MLPTFVIGLREGLEASLIVGIVAAFLRREGRRDALRRMWVGVAAAVVLCVGVGVVLELINRNLPQRRQEMLETVVAVLAVLMVTYMILFMRRHAHSLRGELEARAGVALAAGSSTALVLMAFLAVMREGLETSVFLLAAFQSSTSKAASGAGASLGIAVAIVIGAGIYRGGRRVNLAKFFTATGLVLVLVAAGLMSFAAHTAHEAGWLNIGQGESLNLSGFVKPGTIRSALVTGVLGIQPRPTWAETIAWVLYVVPAAAFLLWPRRRTGVVVASAVAALVLVAACGSSDSNGPGSTGQAVQTIEVTLSDAGCEPATIAAVAGPTTFHVTNRDAGGVTEFEILQGSKMLGEVENVAAGLDRSFSITLKPGSYIIKCPGGSAENGSLDVAVAGAPSTADSAANAAAVASYVAYVDAEVTQLTAAVQPFVAAIKAGDVATAKSLFAAARFHYESIEPIAESFGDLDPQIDAREGDLPAAEWAGFHRIEMALWVDGTTDGMVVVADKLLTDIAALETKIATLELEPAQIANGAVELLNEVSASKITGEEDRYSHTDLSDFAANLDGARAAFDAVSALLSDNDTALRTTIETRFTAVETALAAHQQSGGIANGYVDYTTLTIDQTKALSVAVDALAEPLSRVAALVLK